MLEKSGVGEVLRCEFAEDGQDVLAEEYPEEYVQLAEVDHEFALCQLELVRRCSLWNTDLGDPRSDSSIVVKFSQTRVGYFSGGECLSTVTDNGDARISSTSLGWNSSACRGL